MVERHADRALVGHRIGAALRHDGPFMSSESAARLHPKVVLALVCLIAALIGLNFTVIKFALERTTPLLLAGMRTVAGGTALLTFALARGQRLPTKLGDYGRIFVVSFSITTVSSALLVLGIERVPAGVASLVSSTMPLFTALLSFALLGARVNRLGAVGLVVGFAGTAVLASPSLSGDAAATGIGMLVLSAVAWAFGTVFMRWKDFGGISPIMIVGVQLYMSAAILIPLALVTEGTADTTWSWKLLLPVLYAGIPANAVTFALMAFVTQRASPTQAAASAYLIPVFGVVFAWLIRDEVLGLTEFVGGLLVIAGVYVVVTANTRRHT
jgi:drug/metabolite transporter (DMT)-like permease